MRRCRLTCNNVERSPVSALPFHTHGICRVVIIVLDKSRATVSFPGVFNPPSVFSVFSHPRVSLPLQTTLAKAVLEHFFELDRQLVVDAASTVA